MSDERFNHNTYVIRRKVLKLVGSHFHIYNPAGELEFFVNQKGFKLKEDIRVFTAEDMTHEVLSIKARKAIDFSATYDVYDTRTTELVGSLRRKGLKSIIKDEWIIFDNNESEIGHIKEEHAVLALLRRLILSIIPQSFIGTINGETVFRFNQVFNPFVLKIDLDFSTDKNNLLDKRLGMATAILLCAIEGRQN